MRTRPPTSRPARAWPSRGGARRRCPGNLAQRIIATIALVLTRSPLAADAPGVLNYQGRIAVQASVFNGAGQFKFALVNSNGLAAYWLSSPSSAVAGEPDNSVGVPVSRGLYTVNLGDTNLANMAALPASLFTNGVNLLVADPMYLRVWFSDGTNGFSLLKPDQRISAVGYSLASVYAQSAGSVPDGAIGPAQLAPGALVASNLVGSITPASLPPGIAFKDPDLAVLSNALSASFTAQLLAASNSLVARTSGSLPTNVPGLTVASPYPSDPALLGLGFTPFYTLPAPGWIDSAAPVFLLPLGETAGALTPFGFAIWGGRLAVDSYSGSGAFYQPASDRWSFLGSIGAPAPRAGHIMAWTGSQVLVWGGVGDSGFLANGGRYSPSDFTWGLINTNGMPSGRTLEAYDWTGSAWVIWGGLNGHGLLGDGALYDPSADQWTSLPVNNAPSPRQGASGVWASNSFLVWGGYSMGGSVNSGARLDFPSGAPPLWSPISSRNAPSPRTQHSAIWTGSKLIVFGGLPGGAGPNADSPFGDGGIYDPVADVWMPLPLDGAPSARSGHVAVWTGTEMLIQGGLTASGPTATGAAYDPIAGRWRPLSVAGDPVARSGAVAAWADAALIVFGGLADGAPIGSLQRLNPQPAWALYRRP